MTEFNQTQRRRWVTHLESVTRGMFGDVPFDADQAVKVSFIESFRDEFGNRRASDRAFLAHTLGVKIGATRGLAEMGLDERLWWCVALDENVPPGLLAGQDGLLVHPDALSIEYRTMLELGALHALWILATRDDGLRERALGAARWHIEELQPDNAINRPWGLAVFVELALAAEDESVAQTAELHAQTLLHNACVQMGKPDLLSGLILRDCAWQLRSVV